MTDLPDIEERLLYCAKHGAYQQGQPGLLMREAAEEINQLRGGKNALQAEIERLRALNDDQQKTIDRLTHERHTTKKLLEDLLSRHGLPRP